MTTDYLDMLNKCYGNDPEEAIKIAIEVYKDAGLQLKDIQSRAKKLIEEISVETGKTTWETPTGKVYYPKPSLVVTYDAKALDILCNSDPTLKEKIWGYRRETERAGSMTIK